jgi:hypothetical protein
MGPPAVTSALTSAGTSGGTPAGDPAALVPDPGIDLLRRHFAARRGSERVPFRSDVLLLGNEGPVKARALDLSETGALVEVVDDLFVAEATSGRAGEMLALAERHLQGAIRVQLTSAGVVVEAAVVRMDLGTEAGSPLRLGCRFLRPLGVEERVLLGLDVADADARTLVPRRGTAPFLLLFQEGGATAGPLCAARVLAVVGRRIRALAESLPDAEWLSGRLRTSPLAFSLRGAGPTAWSGRARIASVDAQARSIHVEILADADAPPKALRALRRS